MVVIVSVVVFGIPLVPLVVVVPVWTVSQESESMSVVPRSIWVAHTTFPEVAVVAVHLMMIFRPLPSAAPSGVGSKT